MKHPARYILAFTLVATTLCAGRLFASDQPGQSESRIAGEKLVARLTRSLGRTISHGPMVVQQRAMSAVTDGAVSVPIDPPVSFLLSACQFKLPPPLV